MRGTAVVFALVAVGMVRPEHLPLQPFTIAQGLPSNIIHKIVRDRQGFLWFCTGEGLSRFDGYAFANFGSGASGLPGRVVWDFIESRSGELWVATNSGLLRYVRGMSSAPEVFGAGGGAALVIKETSDGSVWVGAAAGLYRVGSRGLTRVDTGPPPEAWSEPAVTVLEEDDAGGVWFGGFAGLGRVQKNGGVERWTPRQGFVSYAVTALFRDGGGRMWAGTEKGLCLLQRDPRPGRQPAERCYGRADGLPNDYIQSILRANDGRLWVGTLQGAAFSSTLPDHSLRFTSVTARNGLPDDNIEALAQDSAGNLWLGTADDGAVKLGREGVLFFTEQDGLDSPNAIAIVEDARGRLCAITRSDRALAINRFEGSAFRAIRPALPGSVRSSGRGFQQVALQDRSGAWWLATGDGLLRYPPGGVARVPRVYVRQGGPDGHNVFRVFEDSHGDVWWSTSSRIANTLARWDRVRDAVEFIVPPVRSDLAGAFVEDKGGAVWIGFEGGGIARRRPDDGFEYFDPAQGYPGGRVRAAFADSGGRLWFATASGLWRLDDPSSRKPSFHPYRRADGLSSETVYAITEDSRGRIYAGTSVGVDRIDVESGQIEYLSSPGGLPQVMIQDAHRDREGNLWFATRHGVVRFTPGPTAVAGAPPKISILSCKVRGIERGVDRELSLRPDENQVEVAFVAPWFGSPAALRYQYRIEEGGWSAPSAARVVNFAGLKPGRHRFEVRAVVSPGAVSQPAAVAFTIAPPVWLRWWFQCLAAAFVCSIAYGVYRYRMHIVLERERMRARLAADLHDDIGASLSTIAIWSEVGALQSRGNESAGRAQLEKIGTLSREVIDSVSDMVWAIKPENDRFDELGSRIRRYVGDIAAASARDVSFEMSGGDRMAEVGPAVRREAFLVFKEALNNSLRHSGSARCSVAVRCDGDWITLTVSDRGRGFDPGSCTAGNGLATMRRRAARLGGTLEIESMPGEGTVVRLRVPAAADRTRLFRWRA